jgi:hypothetical protein
MTKEYSKMTADELLAENQKLMEKKDAIKAQQRELTSYLSDQQAVVDAEQKIKGMGSEQKAALLQVLKADGIASKAEVGTP